MSYGEYSPTGTGGAGIIWLGDTDAWRTQSPRMLRIISISDESPAMALNSYAFELMGITILVCPCLHGVAGFGFVWSSVVLCVRLLFVLFHVCIVCIQCRVS